MKKLIVFIIPVSISVAIIWSRIPGKKLPVGKSIDRIVIDKSERKMQVFAGSVLLKTYDISLGSDGVGDKEKQGDKRTPEGDYVIDGKNPGSGYHKNLGISYPNKIDVAEARLKGVDPGGDIKIHGIRNGFGFLGKFHLLFDWTAGCIAVTDEEIDELYANVKVGTPVTIIP